MRRCASNGYVSTQVSLLGIFEVLLHGLALVRALAYQSILLYIQ